MSVEISKSLVRDSLVCDKQQLIAANFWATVCPYSKIFKPVFEFESVMLNNQDNLFEKVNIDHMQDIALKRYATKGISVVNFFCESKEVGEAVGYIPKYNFKKDINKMVTNIHSCLANLSPVKPSANNTISILNVREAE